MTKVNNFKIVIFPLSSNNSRNFDFGWQHYTFLLQQILMGYDHEERFISTCN